VVVPRALAMCDCGIAGGPWAGIGLQWCTSRLLLGRGWSPEHWGVPTHLCQGARKPLSEYGSAACGLSYFLCTVVLALGLHGVRMPPLL
jgi:hypothetical protein